MPAIIVLNIWIVIAAVVAALVLFFWKKVLKA